MSARYQAVDQIPVSDWQLQGTVYETALQAKYAAAKLWASGSNVGVRVIRVKTGWTILFWRGGLSNG